MSIEAMLEIAGWAVPHLLIIVGYELSYGFIN